MSGVLDTEKSTRARSVLFVLVPLFLAGCSALLGESEGTKFFNDHIAPEITIIAPTDGSPYTPLVTVEGVVADTVDATGTPGQLDTVGYKVIDREEAGLIMPEADGSFSFSLNTSNFWGTVQLEVYATDRNKNRTTASVSLRPPRSFMSFSFSVTENSAAGLTQDVVCVISNREIQAELPQETDVRALVPRFEYLGVLVSVEEISQISGVTAQDFSHPVEYQITANDGTTSSYAVRIISAPRMPTDLSATTQSEREVALSWTDNSHNEDGFTVQRSIQGEPEFVTIADLAPDTAAYQDAGLEPNSAVAYRVRSYRAGEVSPWSQVCPAETHGFPAPEPTEPLDQAVVCIRSPELQWEPVPGAESYDVRLAAVSADLVAVADAVVSGVTHEPDELLSNHTEFRWEVRATNADGYNSAWSEIRSFQVQWGDIAGLRPIDGDAVGGSRPVLRWNSVPAVTQYQVEYALQPEADDFQQDTSVSTEYRFAGEFPVDATLHWRVRAVGEDGTPGRWSPTITLNHRTYLVGESGPAGGTILYDKGVYSDGWRFLEVAPTDQDSQPWAPTAMRDEIGTDTAIGSGQENTAIIAAAYAGESIAATLCEELELGGRDDWFLPALDELLIMYEKRQLLFDVDPYWDYWSSSENGPMAQAVDFATGQPKNLYSNRTNTVRAMRRF